MFVALKHLEPQPVLLDAQVATSGPGRARVHVAPGVALPGLVGVADVGWEVGGVVVGFDDVADAEGVDVCGGEAAGEGAGAALGADVCWLRRCPLGLDGGGAHELLFGIFVHSFIHSFVRCLI